MSDLLGAITLEDQIACIERELGYRRSVYARRVADQKMSQALSDREISRMEAVLATLKALRAP